MNNVKAQDAKTHKTHVYAYCDPRFTNKGKGYKYEFGNKGKIRMKYRPFYIGAAKRKGHLRHLTGSKSSIFVQKQIKKIREKKLEPIVIVIKSFSLRKEALMLEEKLIVAIGRKDLKTGPLVNRSDGLGGKNSPRVSKRMKRMNEKNWANEEYAIKKKEELRARMKELRNNPEIQKIKSKKMKEVWKKEDYRKKFSEGVRKGFRKPESLNKLIEKRKILLESVEMKERFVPENESNRSGEENNFSKLTNKKVLKMRKLFKEGTRIVDLVKLFNVSRNTVNRVVYRYSWKHI